MLPWFPCSFPRMWWAAVLPVQSANSVCGRQAAPSSRVAGMCLERYTCHSPSYECSSEPQPWIIFSRSRSLSFSFFLNSIFTEPTTESLQLFQHLRRRKQRDGRQRVVSLCLTEESLPNWPQNSTLKEELIWAVRQKACQGSRKGALVGASLSNCKPAQKGADTHHVFVKTSLPVILLCCGSAVE